MQWVILPFRRYFDFSGRSRRMEYWSFLLFTSLVGLIFIGPIFYEAITVAAADPLGDGDPFAGSESAEGISMLGLAGISIYSLFYLAVLIPSIAVTVRRLHDRDLSGWWFLGFIVGSLVPLLGFVASIAFIVVMFLPGTEGPNRFGPDPKDPHSADVFA